MKVVWSAEDIREGRRVCRPGCNEVWLIAWLHKKHGDASHTYLHVSLSDGMVSHQFGSKQALADFLNDAGEQPVELLEAYPGGVA